MVSVVRGKAIDPVMLLAVDIALWQEVYALYNELAITVAVAINADHYSIKKADDNPYAKNEIPTLFDTVIASIAIDASHMFDDENLLRQHTTSTTCSPWGS